jgi:hypothetical protein
MVARSRSPFGKLLLHSRDYLILPRIRSLGNKQDPCVVVDTLDDGVCKSIQLLCMLLIQADRRRLEGVITLLSATFKGYQVHCYLRRTKSGILTYCTQNLNLVSQFRVVSYGCPLLFNTRIDWVALAMTMYNETGTSFISQVFFSEILKHILYSRTFTIIDKDFLSV